MPIDTAVNGHHVPTGRETFDMAAGTMAKSEGLDPETRARIAAHLRKKRLEMGVSKRELARRIGIDPPSLVKILNATRNVGTAVLVKIHRNLHIDMNDLVDFDPPRKFFEMDDDDLDLAIRAEAARQRRLTAAAERPEHSVPAKKTGG